MATPSIQTLRTDAQQVLNLDSISAVRSVVAATLANANAGTPLNPNLTTQQLWNEFYQIITQPKSDIESIIANQLMKFLYAPPAPGGVGANGQVIFNDGGVLAGDPQFLWNKTTNLLTVTGSATITGDLTVDTSTLKVDSTNNRVGIGTASPGYLLDVQAATAVAQILSTTGTNAAYLQVSNTGGVFYLGRENSAGTSFASPAYSAVLYAGGAYPLVTTVNGSERYRIASDGVATWSNVGGVAGTAMTLNSTGLGVGTTINYARLTSSGSNSTGIANIQNSPFASNANTNLSCYIGHDGTANRPFIQAATGNAGSAFDLLIQPYGGNVGVGVTPSAWWSNEKALQIGSGAFFSGRTANPDVAEIGANQFINSSLQRIYIGNGYASRYQQDGGVHQWFTAPSGTAGNAITFTQAMTLDASGNLLVGTTTAGGRLDVQTATGDCAARIKSNAAGSNATLAIDYVNSYGTQVIRKSGTDVWLSGVIADTGATPNYKIQNGSAVGVQLVSGATAWTTLSDETVKDIIEPITNAITKVGSLRSVIGKFKTDSEGTRRSFLIAQDVKSVLPEAVDVVGENNELGLRYTEVIPLLVAAIKELTARVEALEA
jgi:hypothetical protein